jgi:aromatic-L-amino-acid/L-tryptophan decarboxylase
MRIHLAALDHGGMDPVPAPIVSPPLTFLPEEFRALGYHLIDAIAVICRHRGCSRRCRRESRWISSRQNHFPEGEADPAEVFDRLLQAVVALRLPLDYPRCLAFVPGPSKPIGVLADLAATGFNLFGGTWLEAADPTEAELQASGWLPEILGLPPTSEGVFMSGGSTASLTALGVARDRTTDWRRGVVYGSDQTHSSVWKACHILGLSESQQRRLPTDARFRIDISALEAALAEDRAKAVPPIAIVANAGTTNSGAVDPLDGIAELAARCDAWLHVDGAYGLAAVLDPQARTLLSGVGRADSINLGPHKWWF